MSNYLKQLNFYRKKRQYKDFFFCLFLPFIFILIALLLLVLSCIIIQLYRLEVFFISFVIITILYFMHSISLSKGKTHPTEQSVPNSTANEQEIIETNYDLVGMALFTVLTDMHNVLGVKKPVNNEEIYSPNRTIRKDSFILYQYITYRTTGANTTDDIKTILRQEFLKRLQLKSFSGIGQTFHIYQGMSEPILSVYTVEETSSCLTISIALADDNYCRHIRQSAPNAMIEQVRQIKEVVDNDF